MSFLGSLSPLRAKSIPSASKIASSCSMTVESSSSVRWWGERRSLRRYYGSKSRAGWGCGSVNVRMVEDLFIRSLLQASSCGRCAYTTSHHTRATERRISGGNQQRHHTTFLAPQKKVSTKEENEPQDLATEGETPAEQQQLEGRREQGKHISRAEYAKLGLTYHSASASDLWEQAHPPKQPLLPHKKRKTAPTHLPLAPRLVLIPEQETRPPYAKRHILPPINTPHAQHIHHLQKLLKHSKYAPLSKTWHLYLSLPTPRPRYLPDRTLRKLFHRLARVEFKDLRSYRRYFFLLDECLGEGVRVGVEEWNTAIAFAGRWVKGTSKEEVKGAVETWMRMENESFALDALGEGGEAAGGGGVRANHVTFNILFDVAIRAGRFALADTIWNELKARDMPLNRYFRTSMIYYAALRRDGDGVRHAFRELVNAGEIVDTAVMNCVILSLVRCDEGEAAEIVFEKMKTLHETKFGRTPNPRTWIERRELGIRLHLTAQRLRRERKEHESSFFGAVFAADEKKEAAQRAAPIHPDARTYQILIRYHALHSGNLGRIRQLVQEMRDAGWNVHGSCFLDVFKGFALWGGHAYTEWTRAGLERFWEEFVRGLGPPPPPPSSPLLEMQEMRGEREVGVGEPTPASPSRTPAERGSSLWEDSELEVENEMEEDDDEEISNESLAPYFTPHLVIRVLRAFYKCAGRKKMLQVWAVVLERWEEITEEERGRIEQVVERLGADF